MTSVVLERTYAPLEVVGKAPNLSPKPRILSLEIRHALSERLQLEDMSVQYALRALRMAHKYGDQVGDHDAFERFIAGRRIRDRSRQHRQDRLELLSNEAKSHVLRF